MKTSSILLFVICSEFTSAFTVNSFPQSQTRNRLFTSSLSSYGYQQHRHQRNPLHRVTKSDHNEEDNNNDSKLLSEKITYFGQMISNRSDTFRSAGFYDEDDHLTPLESGVKANIIIFCLAIGYKWYRSIFINKMAIWERQPQWNTVITSKEDEEKANLEAMSCNNCGATIFIAKGRKWFQMPRGYECYCCGAKGDDNFTNNRKDLLEELGDADDYFDYEKPLDFVSAAERKKLMKQAGGDEAKANELLAQQSAAAASDQSGIVDGVGTVEKKKKKKKKASKKKKKEDDSSSEEVASDENVPEISSSKETSDVKKKSKPVKKEPDDDLDILGMD